MNDVAIRAQHLSKEYRLGGRRTSYKTLRESLVKAAGAPIRWLRGERQEKNTFWALDDLSFEVKHGEAVGIIGRNGAGKSTLLKILSRITRPTRGRAELFGRVGALLEVGTGFHGELTGRENIYLSGAILGMGRREIARKFDAIVDFADVERFLETPVKFYSSGMYVRLAFAVAAHLEPEILVVDEVLAVGDAEFQKKCLGKMGNVAGEGRTVLFVSHNLSAIVSLCPRSIWLDRGVIKSYGGTDEIISEYRHAMHFQDPALLANTVDRKGDGRLKITNLYLVDSAGNVCQSTPSGMPVSFVLEYSATRDTRLSDIEINLFVVNDRENRLFALTNKASGDRLVDIPRQGRMKCHVPSLPVIPGEYNLHFSCLIRGQLADKVLFAAKFMVTEGDFFNTGILPPPTFGDMLVKHSWRVESAEASG